METKTNSSDLKELERSVLAALVACPRFIKEIALPLNVTEDTFTIIEHRSLWRELAKAGDGDSVKLIALYAKELRLEKSKAEEEIFNLYLTNPEKLWFRVQDLTRQAYAREVQIATQNAVAKALAMNANPELMNAMIKEAVDAVPRPPEPGWAAFDAMVDGKEAEGEIPEELLHIPGFIDELVEYNLKRAHRPHRTLAFSGALALLAHLMGRKFTDRRGTRPNLYLIALGNTGIGKEFARALNKELAYQKEIDHTIVDQIASGEALEDYLAYSPTLLAEMDEIHNTLGMLKDSSNSNALGISKFLLTFYSESASTHTMRLKASQTGVKIDPKSRKILQPSLTLYGTATPIPFYQSLTQRQLDDGLVGRCLVMEAVNEGPSNDFEGETPLIPSMVEALIDELSRKEKELELGGKINLFTIPYASDEVSKRIKEIGVEADKLKAASNKNGDLAGVALWARSLEKVCKIAMIYAVSVDYASPVITLESIDYSWSLVKVLTKRMINRAARWITNGKIDELCARVMNVFETTKLQQMTRRVMLRHVKMDHDALVKVEATLQDRGEIFVIQGGRGSVTYVIRSKDSEVEHE